MKRFARQSWFDKYTSGMVFRPQRKGQMNEETKTAADMAGPAAYSWLTYGWVMMIAAWGGLVRFLNNLRTRKHSWRDGAIHLCIGLVTSMFVGVITFFLCEAMQVNQLLTAALVAATGHMGADGIRIYEDNIRRRIRRWLGDGGA